MKRRHWALACAGVLLWPYVASADPVPDEYAMPFVAYPLVDNVLGGRAAEASR